MIIVCYCILLYVIVFYGIVLYFYRLGLPSDDAIPTQSSGLLSLLPGYGLSYRPDVV